jgi:nucleoside-diphosphate-sugar epimerase
MSRILVTGATGFLGSAVVRQLQQAGCAVRATGRQAKHHSSLDYWPADLRESTTLPEMLEGVSCIIHCAGLAHQFDSSPKQDWRFQGINCEATERLARVAAAKGVKRFVFVSSVSVYGPAGNSGLRNEDAVPIPSGPYAKSKRLAEIGLLRIASETDLQVLILRMATLYGEGDPGNLGRLMKSIQRGRFLMIGPGENKKSLIHRDDAARACVRAALIPTDRPVGIWNVTGEPCSMKDIVHGISAALCREPPRRSVPAGWVSGLLWTASAVGIGRLRRWANSRWAMVQKWLAEDAYDGSRFAEEFQWHPQIQLEVGLRRLASDPQPLRSLTRAA